MWPLLQWKGKKKKKILIGDRNIPYSNFYPLLLSYLWQVQKQSGSILLHNCSPCHQILIPCLPFKYSHLYITLKWNSCKKAGYGIIPSPYSQYTGVLLGGQIATGLICSKEASGKMVRKSLSNYKVYESLEQLSGKAAEILRDLHPWRSLRTS